MSPHADTLVIELDVPSQATVGASVPMVIRLRNTADRPIELHLMGRQIVFELVVEGPGGEVVWERLGDASAMAILRLETLGPDRALELSHEWDQRDNEGRPVGEGTYSVRGVVPTDEPQPLMTPAIELRIVPRQ